MKLITLSRFVTSAKNVIVVAARRQSSGMPLSTTRISSSNKCPRSNERSPTNRRPPPTPKYQTGAPLPFPTLFLLQGYKENLFLLFVSITVCVNRKTEHLFVLSPRSEGLEQASLATNRRT